ncbi:conserved Plasmodium protein, unknown function [Plasmodium ovale]|uniref:Uncharacterized protein n=1 Tax=Plasmodium ovale TaxID=36330 RepID=A0A1D3U802_PLAOA|nr:conserved Plasmodium protein, unknown function [Plasmodium ovale]
MNSEVIPAGVKVSREEALEGVDYFSEFLNLLKLDENDEKTQSKCKYDLLAFYQNGVNSSEKKNYTNNTDSKNYEQASYSEEYCENKKKNDVCEEAYCHMDGFLKVAQHDCNCLREESGEVGQNNLGKLKSILEENNTTVPLEKNERTEGDGVICNLGKKEDSYPHGERECEIFASDHSQRDDKRTGENFSNMRKQNLPLQNEENVHNLSSNSTQINNSEFFFIKGGNEQSAENEISSDSVRRESESKLSNIVDNAEGETEKEESYQVKDELEKVIPFGEEVNITVDMNKLMQMEEKENSSNRKCNGRPKSREPKINSVSQLNGEEEKCEAKVASERSLNRYRKNLHLFNELLRYKDEFIYSDETTLIGEEASSVREEAWQVEKEASLIGNNVCSEKDNIHINKKDAESNAYLEKHAESNESPSLGEREGQNLWNNNSVSKEARFREGGNKQMVISPDDFGQDSPIGSLNCDGSSRGNNPNSGSACLSISHPYERTFSSCTSGRSEEGDLKLPDGVDQQNIQNSLHVKNVKGMHEKVKMKIRISIKNIYFVKYKYIKCVVTNSSGFVVHTCTFRKDVIDLNEENKFFKIYNGNKEKFNLVNSKDVTNLLQELKKVVSSDVTFELPFDVLMIKGKVEIPSTAFYRLSLYGIHESDAKKSAENPDKEEDEEKGEMIIKSTKVKTDGRMTLGRSTPLHGISHMIKPPKGDIHIIKMLKKKEVIQKSSYVGFTIIHLRYLFQIEEEGFLHLNISNKKSEDFDFMKNYNKEEYAYYLDEKAIERSNCNSLTYVEKMGILFKIFFNHSLNVSSEKVFLHYRFEVGTIIEEEKEKKPIHLKKILEIAKKGNTSKYEDIKRNLENCLREYYRMCPKSIYDYVGLSLFEDRTNEKEKDTCTNIDSRDNKSSFFSVSNSDSINNSFLKNVNFSNVFSMRKDVICDSSVHGSYEDGVSPNCCHEWKGTDNPIVYSSRRNVHKSKQIDQLKNILLKYTHGINDYFDFIEFTKDNRVYKIYEENKKLKNYIKHSSSFFVETLIASNYEIQKLKHSNKTIHILYNKEKTNNNRQKTQTNDINEGCFLEKKNKIFQNVAESNIPFEEEYPTKFLFNRRDLNDRCISQNTKKEPSSINEERSGIQRSRALRSSSLGLNLGENFPNRVGGNKNNRGMYIDKMIDLRLSESRKNTISPGTRGEKCGISSRSIKSGRAIGRDIGRSTGRAIGKRDVESAVHLGCTQNMEENPFTRSCKLWGGKFQKDHGKRVGEDSSKNNDKDSRKRDVESDKDNCDDPIIGEGKIPKLFPNTIGMHNREVLREKMNQRCHSKSIVSPNINEDSSAHTVNNSQCSNASAFCMDHLKTRKTNLSDDTVKGRKELVKQRKSPYVLRKINTAVTNRFSGAITSATAITSGSTSNTFASNQPHHLKEVKLSGMGKRVVAEVHERRKPTINERCTRPIDGKGSDKHGKQQHGYKQRKDSCLLPTRNNNTNGHKAVKDPPPNGVCDEGMNDGCKGKLSGHAFLRKSKHNYDTGEILKKECFHNFRDDDNTSQVSKERGALSRMRSTGGKEHRTDEKYHNCTHSSTLVETTATGLICINSSKKEENVPWDKEKACLRNGNDRGEPRRLPSRLHLRMNNNTDTANYKKKYIEGLVSSYGDFPTSNRGYCKGEKHVRDGDNKANVTKLAKERDCQNNINAIKKIIDYNLKEHTNFEINTREKNALLKNLPSTSLQGGTRKDKTRTALNHTEGNFPGVPKKNTSRNSQDTYILNIINKNLNKSFDQLDEIRRKMGEHLAA